MRFDFAIFDESQLMFLFELDGEGHYLPIPFGKMTETQAQENLKQQQIRDQIKTDYCKKNDIQLIRVPYWDFDNIEDILTSVLIERNEVKKVG